MEIFITRDITLKTRVETGRTDRYMELYFDGHEFILDNEHYMQLEDFENLLAAAKTLSMRYLDETEE